MAAGAVDARAGPAALDRRAALAGGLAACLPLPVRAQRPASVRAEALDASYVMARLGPGRSLRGYLVRQRGGETLPGVVLVHGDRGFGPRVRAVADRLATEGYLAFAPDMLSAVGGTPAEAGRAAAAMRQVDVAAAAADAGGAVEWIGRGRRTTGAVALLGMGWGGTVTNRAAAAGARGLRAGVAYYAGAPAPAAAIGVRAALLLHFAGSDARVNRAGERWVRALQQGGRTVGAFFYPGTGHGFADSAAPAYHAAAARLAWERTAAFLQRELA